MKPRNANLKTTVILTIMAGMILFPAHAPAGQTGLENIPDGNTTDSATVQSDKVWTLQECIDYAYENNISIKISGNDLLSGQEDIKQSKAAMFPSLSASTSQRYAYSPVSASGNGMQGSTSGYNWTYNLNISVPIYMGGRLQNNLKTAKLSSSINELEISGMQNDIRMSLITAYMQILYASESVKINETSAEASRQQLEKAIEMYNTGSINKADLAQVKSEYENDLHQIIVAKNTLSTYNLELKQLLEMGISDTVIISKPEIPESMVLSPVPDKTTLCMQAIDHMPETEISEMQIKLAELDVKTAKSGYYPQISFTATTGTGSYSGTGESFGTQLWNNFSQTAGVTISIPIYSNRENKTAENKAIISLDNSKLNYQNTLKSLTREIESLYNDLISAQSQYISAKENLKYAEESYRLTDEKFKNGAADIVELINAKSTYLNASQSALQAKFTAIMNIELINVYTGKNTSEFFTK